MRKKISHEKVKAMAYGIFVGVSLLATLGLGILSLKSCKTVNINPSIYPTIAPSTDVINDNLVDDFSTNEGYESDPLSIVEDVIEKPSYLGNDYLYLEHEKEFMRNEAVVADKSEYYTNGSDKEEESNENFKISRKTNKRFLIWLLLFILGGGIWILRRFMKKEKK